MGRPDGFACTECLPPLASKHNYMHAMTLSWNRSPVSIADVCICVTDSIHGCMYYSNRLIFYAARRRVVGTLSMNVLIRGYIRVSSNDCGVNTLLCNMNDVERMGPDEFMFRKDPVQNVP